MSGFLDNSVLIRHLTRDDPELARRAAAIIEGPSELWLDSTIIAEACYTLESYYGWTRTEIAESLGRLVSMPNISTYALDKDLVLRALRMCAPSRRVSFAGAMLWAAARSAGQRAVYTFDQRFPTEGLELRQSLP